MNIASAFVVPALLAPSPLPSPTPNLSPSAQKLSDALVAEGVATEGVVKGKKYIAREKENVIGLYNDKDHVIVLIIFKSLPIPLRPPFPTEVIGMKTVTMDGEVYAIYAVGDPGNPSIIVCDFDGNPIIAAAGVAGICVPMTLKPI